VEVAAGFAKASRGQLAILPAALAAVMLAASAPAQQPPSPPTQPSPEGTATAAPPAAATAPEASAQRPPRILGIIPAFEQTNRQHGPALTAGGKFRIFARQTFDPFQWISAGAQAGLSQGENHLAGYGQGAAGYGKRYGAAMADLTDHEFTSNFLLPVMLKEDPRYFRLGRGTIPHRIVYSLEQEFWCKTDAGTRQFNFSKVLGAVASKALSNSYYPPADRGAGLTLSRSGLSIASGMAAALGTEFWPDIDCKVFHQCRGM